MKIKRASEQGNTVVKPSSTAGHTNTSVAGAQNSAAGDSIELSPQAQKLVKAQQNASAQAQTQTTQTQTQETTLLDSAKNMITSNPAKARSQLETIIAQYPDSAEAQKARQLLAELPQSGKRPFIVDSS